MPGGERGDRGATGCTGKHTRWDPGRCGCLPKLQILTGQFPLPKTSYGLNPQHPTPPSPRLQEEHKEGVACHSPREQKGGLPVLLPWVLFQLPNLTPCGAGPQVSASCGTHRSLAARPCPAAQERPPVASHAETTRWKPLAAECVQELQPGALPSAHPGSLWSTNRDWPQRAG